mgnify:CR=1 FL=1
MKLSRLFQPRNPLFWLMLILNALSSVLSWMLHTREYPTPVLLLLAGFALGNAVLGLWIAVRLMRDPPPSQQPVA